MTTNEYIEIKRGNGRARLSLQQVQHILDCISADYSNSELCAVLDLFVADNDRKEREEETRRIEEGLKQQMFEDEIKGHQEVKERTSDD